MNDAEALLIWYDTVRRALPWRDTRDPYRIWVSEVMLQQTRVKTVIPYYESFIGRFPAVGDLAAASLDEVLAIWSGLGYYRRARQLHQAAKRIVAMSGKFPTSSRELQDLPGIGSYTAAAVASMAFDEPVPALDGNVARVLCRRLGLDQDPNRSGVRRKLFDAAADLLDRARPGDSNQAMMELGATVCRPQQTDCGSCPLRQGCEAFRLGDPQRYPPPRHRRAVERVERVVAVARQRGKVLLFRRPDESTLLAGMWELPNVRRRARLVANEEALTQRYGGKWRLKAASGKLRHGITHRALHLYIHPARFSAGDEIAEGPEAAWVEDSERDSFPVSSMVDKVLKAES